MADSIRELIVKDIKAALELISKANGYENDIRSVQRFLQPGQKTLSVPVILISEGEENVEQTPARRVRKEHDIHVVVATQQDVETDPRSGDEIMNTLRADIEKAVLVDRTRSGNAIDTFLVSQGPVEVEEGQPYLEAALTFRVAYLQRAADPYTLG